MRALALLLVVVVAVLLVIKFYPSSEVEGAGGDASATSDPADFEDQFLIDGSGQNETLPLPAAGGATAETTPANTPAVAETAPPVEPPPAVAPRTASVHDAGDAAVGAALLHGTPQDLSRVLDAEGIDGSRRLCLTAFAEAKAGQRARAENLASRIDGAASVPAEERRALEMILGESGASPRPASGGPEGPVVLAMHMVLLDREAQALLQAGASAAAARDFSELLLLELDAPWPSARESLQAWSAGLEQAQRNHRWNPRGEWPSETMKVQDGDHLTAIRKRYLAQFPDRILCTGLVARANRISGFIHPGDDLRIPTDPVSVIVDLGARWALYLHGDEVVAAWEVGVGRQGEETITGTFRVGIKKENPMWTRIGQEAIPFGDERNPLGTRWIGWNQDGRATSYGFHGTKEPDSIGKAASDGCIRFHNRNVEALFEILPVGAPIHVRE